MTRWERGVRVEGDTWQMFFSRDGFLAAYKVDGRELMAEGPNCARSSGVPRPKTTSGRSCTSGRPYGRTPNCSLRSSTLRSRTGWAVVEALYELPAVKATLALTYRINGAGEMEVTERMNADKTAEVPNLFRFGMTLTMPARYDRVVYYGRGATELCRPPFVGRPGALRAACRRPVPR